MLVAAAVVLAGLYFAKDVLLPIALAILFTFLLLPVTRRIERLGVGRLPAVLGTIVIATAVLGGITWLVAYQFSELGRDLPRYKTALLERIGAIKNSTNVVESVTNTIDEIDEQLKSGSETTEVEVGKGDAEKSVKVVSDADSRDPTGDSWWQRTLAPLGVQLGRPEPVEIKVSHAPVSPLTQVKEWLGPILSPLITGGLVVVLVAFFLLQREDLRNRIVELFGAANLYATTEAIEDAEERVSKYLRAQFVLNTAMGCTVGVAMWLFGMPTPVLWGALAMLLRFVPYLGPTLATVLPVVLSFAVFEGWARPIGVLSFFVVAELIFNNVLEPLAYGNSIGVSATGVIVSALFWTWLWGPVGLVLAMPLTVCVVIMSRYIPQMRTITILMSERSALLIEERIYQRLLAYDDEEAACIVKDQIERASLDAVMDGAVLATLRLAERDRHAGALDSDRAEFVIRSMQEIAAEAIEGAEPESDGDGAATGDGRKSVLCVAVGDRADEAANAMLAMLVRRTGVDAETIGAGALPAEVVEAVNRDGVGVVALSILPPLSTRDGRYLCRCLRARYPDVPIVVGIWQDGDPGALGERFRGDGGTYIATTLSAAVKRIRQCACTTGGTLKDDKSVRRVDDEFDSRKPHPIDARVGTTDATT